MEHKDIFEEIGVTDVTPIGEGQESIVYDLNDGRVLKVLKKTNMELIESEQLLYEKLANANLPIRFPRILHIGHVNDKNYLLEEKLDGEPMNKVLERTPDPQNRLSLLCEMLLAVNHMRTIRFKDEPYGDIVATDPLRETNWITFLKHKVNEAYAEQQDEIDKANPFGNNFMEHFERRVDELLGNATIEKVLVHGDYWPNNLLVQDGVVTGIIDFGGTKIHSMVGDYLIDVASGLEFSKSWLPQAEQIQLLYEAEHLFGSAIKPILNLYILYYAVFFIAVKDTDPESFQWAKEVLSRSDMIL
jgi:aminoglycoside phosphotransferase